MSVLSWNCRGLGSPLAIRTLTKEVKGKNPMVVFLVETKVTTDKMKGFQHKLGFTQGIIVPSDGKSGGLALIKEVHGGLRDFMDIPTQAKGRVYGSFLML